MKAMIKNLWAAAVAFCCESKAFVASTFAVFASLFFSGAAWAQATIPANVQSEIDDAVEMAELIGWALVTVAVAILAFRYIRKVLR